MVDPHNRIKKHLKIEPSSVKRIVKGKCVVFHSHYPAIVNTGKAGTDWGITEVIMTHDNRIICEFWIA